MKKLNDSPWKKYLPYIAAIALFIAFALIYCWPVIEGKVLQAGDTMTWKGMYQETKEYTEKTGDEVFWTGSMFSGMPNYQIGGGDYTSQKSVKFFGRLMSLGFTGPVASILMYLLGFFILLRSFNVNKWMSIIGAMAIALSSYFIIIIEAGHATKVSTIALMAPVLAGFVLIFRKKYLWGFILTMLYVMVGLMQHPQMSYYYFLLIGCLFCAELFTHIKEKRWKDLLIGTCLFAVAVGIGIGTRYTKMQLNREYVKETMRGGHSELAKAEDEENKTSGLDLDYATQWSYGIDETFTLLIPNFKGGSSHYDVGNNKVYSALRANGIPPKNATEFSKSVPTYWGAQPFTSGPVYVGAIIVFLFVLGLAIVKGPYKWALLVATIFSVLLSWGHNFMPLTRFFFEYIPMYDKFRAVSSILVVAEITIPLLGFLAIKAIMDKQIDKKALIQKIYWSAGITAGLCLIFALFGGWMYNFTSPNDAENFAQLPEWLGDAIVAERASLFRGDAIRSMIFILLGAGTLWLFVQEKLKLVPFILVSGILIVSDLWAVDRRFLNSDNFITPKQESSYFKKLPYEEAMLQDPDPNYRVFNLTRNTFNESRTSYYFKSLGGYHGAKLRRYQDLISEHLANMNWNVINMLNAKYIVVPGNNNEPVAQQNPDAMGNAWFIDSVLIVNTPNEESEALNTINIRNMAVLDVQFADFVKDFSPGADTNASVEFLSYAPDQLEYQYNSSKDGILVFSEIYYPYGWKAFIDDQPVEHFRANYALRALPVPAGEHHVKFIFDPDTLHKSERVAITCVVIMYLILIGGIIYSIIARRKEKSIAKTSK